jgi:hypothetical protein
MAIPAKDAVKFIVKNGPKAMAAAAALMAFLKDHPALPSWFRHQADELRKRIAKIPERHGDAARIRGMLDIIRDVAQQTEAHGPQGSGATAASWIARADNIEQRVRLAEAQQGATRKKTLARIATETDELLAALIEETARPGA